jgi:hypothetical protein
LSSPGTLPDHHRGAGGARGLHHADRGAIFGGELRDQRRIVDDHPAPDILVRPVGGLHRQLEAFLEQGARYWPGHVEPLADRAGGAEHLVDRKAERHDAKLGARATSSSRPRP